MKMFHKTLLPVLLAAVLAFALSCGRSPVVAGETRADEGAAQTGHEVQGGKSMLEKVVKSDAEWKKTLTPEQYRVLRKKGTERAFSSPLYKIKEKGGYRCAGCDLDLFSSEAKYDSGTGWPSFWEPIDADHVLEQDDFSLFSRRTEVLCARCDGHLGHVFKDGPLPTGLRYCMNGVALKFVPEEGKTDN